MGWVPPVPAGVRWDRLNSQGSTLRVDEILAHPNHPLTDHLESVAKLAAQFAADFGSSSWAELAGLWHDMGKFQPAFQRRLCGDRTSVEHSGAGAAYATSLHPTRSIPLAFVIAGHHAGMANLIRNESGGPLALKQRIEANRAQHICHCDGWPVGRVS